MVGFNDYDKFKFVDMDFGGKKYLTPVHYRELGEKEGKLYSKKVTWSDVVINEVPLEKTFEFQDFKPIYEKANKEYSQNGTIFVNERRMIHPIIPEEDDSDYHYEKRWMNRLFNIVKGPVNLPQAKKKRKSVEKYPVKPKCKKMIRDEKLIQSSEKFEEFTDERDTEYMNKFFDHINRSGEYEDVPIFISGEMASPESGWPEGLTTFKKRKLTPYYPPEHWTKPDILWEKIWSHMDTLEKGRKRDYHYIPKGEFDSEGYPGPAIFFYDRYSDDLNYNFNFSTDYKYAGPWNRWVSFNL